MMMFDEGTNSYLECCSLPKLHIQFFGKAAVDFCTETKHVAHAI